MRKEETIGKMLVKLQTSKYAEYHIEEIGTLLWVISEAKTIAAGIKNSRNIVRGI